MTSAESSPLPDFGRPPVVEVVCGITFKPIEDLIVTHLGQLWERYKPEYPDSQEQPPLPRVIERPDLFGAPSSDAVLPDFPFVPRIWFTTEDEARLIQVQKDRFLHNWKKILPDDEYPRYPQVIKMFKDTLERFELFLAERELGAVEPLQYELTYVNHIPREEGWNSLADIGSVFPDLGWRNQSSRFLPEPEITQWKTAFGLPQASGRLHVTIQKAVNREDKSELIRMDLTARGIGPDKSRNAMYNWFDMAREWIVRGFVDLTGDNVQREHWQRKD